MRVYVNDKTETLEPGTTIAELLARFELAPQRVAVEVNEELVKRAGYADARLSEDDRVEIVTMVGGG